MNKKESDHLYYLENKERIISRVKKYAEEHKEEIKEKRKIAFQKRKEKKKAEKRFTVYLRKNLINGMQYVGQTEDFEGREYDWACLKVIYANELISADREKYGLENFETEILAIVDNREDAWKLEQKYIKELNTKTPNGYNICDGGGGSTGFEPWNKGIKGCFSEETIQRMSEAKLGYIPWNKGVDKCYSEETLQKMSKAKKGKPNTALMKEIHQFNSDGELVKIWKKESDCRKAGFHHASDVANGKRKQDKGFIFKYPKK